jgi:hypothetical protein
LNVSTQKPPPLQFCGDFCTDIFNDPFNCGGCFNSCGPGGFCSGGFCQMGCPMGLTNCGGQCVDVSSDPFNCGGCFINCGPGGSCGNGLCNANGCPEISLGPQLPQTTSGSTNNQDDDIAPLCAPGGGNDVVYQFTAPATAQYTIDTFGSSFDTVLHVHDGGCFGPELACNDDVPNMGLSSSVTVSLGAGQTVMIAVDGFGQSLGDYTLHIQSSGGNCPQQSLGGQYPVTVSGTTVGQQNTMTAQCVPAVGPEVSYSWTAPFAGTFVFDTLGSSFDTVLYVRSGSCAGPELGCNDDWNGLSSQTSVFLNAGQTVVVVVDGFGAGNYVLNIK